MLSFESVILENDKTIAYYGISNTSEILLIENAFQEHLVNQDVDLIELDSWLDYLTTDYENCSRFVRDVDYIMYKLHENEHKPYALDSIDRAMQFVKKCSERALKLQQMTEELAQKYCYLSSECSRFYQIISNSKDEQIALAKGPISD